MCFILMSIWATRTINRTYTHISAYQRHNRFIWIFSTSCTVPPAKPQDSSHWASITPTSWNLLFAAIMFCTYICYWQFLSTQYISQYTESTYIKVSFYVNTQHSYNLGMVTNQSTPSYFVPITKHSLDYFYVMCQQDIIAKSAHNDIFSYFATHILYIHT